MKIAVPTSGGALCMHFGHCEEFAVVNIKDDKVASIEMMTPPPHEPGVLPKWLGELGVNVIIAGGMGSRAQQLFAAAGVKVVVGAQSTDPTQLVNAYIAGTLESGDNVCDH